MALYETGTASTTDDFVDKLMDFATVTNTGFTQNNRDLGADTAALNDGGSLFVQMDWDTNDIALYQSLGFTGPAPWGGETDDSGSGHLTGTTGRGLHLPAAATGPYTSYHFFTDHATAGTYVHAVIEYSSGIYRHMGFGNISKIGDWTGGEYCYGHQWSQLANDIDAPKDLLHACPWDTIGTSAPDKYPTMHIEGMPDQGASSKWGVMWGGTSPGTDTAAVARVNLLGGMRDGPIMNMFGGFSTNPVNGFIALVPLAVMYHNTTPAPDELTLLGFAPDTRYVNMKNLTPGAVYTVGAEKWRVFPLVRKQYLKDDTEESWNAGIAYRDYVS